METLRRATCRSSPAAIRRSQLRVRVRARGLPDSLFATFLTIQGCVSVYDYHGTLNKPCGVLGNGCQITGWAPSWRLTRSTLRRDALQTTRIKSTASELTLRLGFYLENSSPCRPPFAAGCNTTISGGLRVRVHGLPPSIWAGFPACNATGRACTNSAAVQAASGGLASLMMDAHVTSGTHVPQHLSARQDAYPALLIVRVPSQSALERPHRLSSPARRGTGSVIRMHIIFG